MATIRSIGLGYQEGSSDKVYYASIEEHGGKHDVKVAWGRRGAALQEGNKASGVSLDEAVAAYDKVVNEKTKKGYKQIEGDQPSGTTTVAAAGVPRPVVATILPQLCHAINVPYATDYDAAVDRALEPYILNDDWAFEEKKNGKHRTIIVSGGSTTVTNKYGEPAGCRGEVLAEVKAVKGDFTLDIEDECVQLGHDGLGCCILGLLSLDGKPLTDLTDDDRRQATEEFFHDNRSHFKAITLVDRAVGVADKRAMVKRLHEENAEGVILKNRRARHSPGRPASGGNHLKAKYWKTMSVVVGKQNKGRRSVQIFVLDGLARLHIGNCTIQPDKDVPPEHSIIEVRYLYVDSKLGKMVQCNYMMDRTDEMSVGNPRDQKQLQRSLLCYKQGVEEEGD